MTKDEVSAARDIMARMFTSPENITKADEALLSKVSLAFVSVGQFLTGPDDVELDNG